MRSGMRKPKGTVPTLAAAGLATFLLVQALPLNTYVFGKANFAVGNYAASAAVRDFNGDGRLDLVVVNQVTAQFSFCWARRMDLRRQGRLRNGCEATHSVNLALMWTDPWYAGIGSRLMQDTQQVARR